MTEQEIIEGLKRRLAQPTAESVDNIGAVFLPLRIGTTIIDRDEHGEYYMIQCATEQAAQRRMEKCLN